MKHHLRKKIVKGIIEPSTAMNSEQPQPSTLSAAAAAQALQRC
jgi:hypothetical protein